MADFNMTKEEWTNLLEAEMDKQRALIGHQEVAPISYKGVYHPYSMALARTLCTEDAIRQYTGAIGDTNPLWSDAEYAKSTRWGGIIAPPVSEIMFAEGSNLLSPPVLPGMNCMNGGSTREYFIPLRPGDTVRAIDKFESVEEHSNPDKPYRLFFRKSTRRYYNQREEHVLSVSTTEINMATYPGDKKEMSKAAFEQPKRHYFSKEELEEIYQGYRDELAGKNRRGKEIRYFEDVNVGDDIGTMVKGPYDISDAVAFFGACGYAAAFAPKYAITQIDPDRLLTDPETGAIHMAPDWHFVDDLARIAGLPFAQMFGTHIEACVIHNITNWMGDDAQIRKIESQIRSMSFLGELITAKGTVVEKKVEDGKHLVVIDAWHERNGKKAVSMKVTVQLISKED